MDLYGGLLVVFEAEGSERALHVHRACQIETRCWLTGLFPWQPLQVSAPLAAAKSWGGGVGGGM